MSQRVEKQQQPTGMCHRWKGRFSSKRARASYSLELMPGLRKYRKFQVGWGVSTASQWLEFAPCTCPDDEFVSHPNARNAVNRAPIPAMSWSHTGCFSDNPDTRLLETCSTRNYDREHLLETVVAGAAGQEQNPTKRRSMGWVWVCLQA